MSRPTRDDAAGRAYLDLQKRARTEGRSTQELLILYVAERWLERMSKSEFADRFILKGGMLLAAFGSRRTTADADALARGMENDEHTVKASVIAIASRTDLNDGVQYLTDTASTRIIRDEALYAGVRVAMDARISTAIVKLRLDINFGDPVTPAPQIISLPALRPGMEPIRVFGYPMETVLAEKLVTATWFGPVNTRVRDYADVFTLITKHDLVHRTVRKALYATADFRNVELSALSTVIEDLVALRQETYMAYRSSLRSDGTHLPADFADVIEVVLVFADPLLDSRFNGTTWKATERRWR